jgi:hypothetical protein|tara:strand:- start:348 stop:551 length:204 start_codon:yes stop_codon:yes gene_type:complete
MSDILSQPRGSATQHKEGTILVQGPEGAGSGVLGSNYTIDTYVQVPAVPTTGTIVNKYTGRFDFGGT